VTLHGEKGHTLEEKWKNAYLFLFAFQIVLLAARWTTMLQFYPSMSVILRIVQLMVAQFVEFPFFNLLSFLYFVACLINKKICILYKPNQF
jgi:hypothetical protein